ncbi:uncharacterized protein HMPREF1541_00907 [Cyphellophora europaea CBS 101466]|uniref:Histone chaperone domain-containing protein n=1 Tax=Cyphellophora europaea (strain CBS 101466) TaxID=1220924 RepID=W2SFA0_CYPE1|nr:uncharacterized protein HMPREF1541_00907 [Cyphellophora europaea CBS 101466]ETN46718.1 hypothetical protein HMPREF1541_00907 [Cyphellophora europaea CBS 101466]
MSAPQDNFQEEGSAPAQNDYQSRTGQKDHIPVQSDEANVEDPIDAETADSDAQLERDDADAIDTSNIVDERTRGATKSYREPGDDEGLGDPEDGRSRVAGGPN